MEKMYRPRKGQRVVYLGFQPTLCRILEVRSNGTMQLESIQVCGPFGALQSVGLPFDTEADQLVVRTADFRSVGTYGQRWEATLTRWQFN